MGNSEVGHLNLGAGAVVTQDLTRIDEAVARRHARRERRAARRADAARRACTSSGSSPTAACTRASTHLRGADRAWRAELGVPDVVVHAFTDGRDTSPTGGERLPRATSRSGATRPGNARVGTVIGRYFAMDRDKRWDRMQQAYDLLVHGHGRAPRRRRAARRHAPPTTRERDRRVHHRDDGRRPRRAIRPGDSVIAFNFRPDRMREITRALADPAFTDVDRGGGAGRRALRHADRVRRGLAVPGRLPARRGRAITLPQRHRGERRAPAARRRDREVPARDVLLRRRRGGARARASAASSCPSPRDVPTYDFKPEMSAREAADAFVGAWREDAPRVRRSSTSPTPTWSATRASSRRRSRRSRPSTPASGDVVAAVQETGGALLVTADHGNADQMLEDDGSPEHRALAEPGAVRRHRSRARRSTRRGHPRRRRADDRSRCSASSSRPR